MNEDKVQVVRCENCVNWDGTYCRSTEFVSFHMVNGRKKWDVTNVWREREDYCSKGEEGDYEPWGGLPGEYERLRK